MTAQTRNIAALIAVKNAAGPAAMTAGGAGDNTLVTGIIIDRAALGWPQSAELVIPFTATLAASATLSVAVTLQHSDASDMSGAGTFDSIANAAVATGPAGGGTVVGETVKAVSLAGAKRYLRLNFTPDLSAAGTDTARVGAILAFGGNNRLPV
jgi:hypothetical protein